jgi:hypothetical protein
MSRTLRRAVDQLPAHLAGAAAVVLLAACSGNGDSTADSTPAGSTPASEPAESEPGGTNASGDDFCAQAADIDQRVESSLNDLEGEDPSVADAFTELAAELREMEPPDAIASDWDAMAGGLDRMATAFADFDLTDPDTLAALEAAEGELTEASSNVEDYLREECGIN